MRHHFTVVQDSGQVIINSQVEQLIRLAGVQSLFTLRFAAIEMDSSESDAHKPSEPEAISGRIVHLDHEHRLTHPELVSGWKNEDSEVELLEPSSSDQNSLSVVEKEGRNAELMFDPEIDLDFGSLNQSDVNSSERLHSVDSPVARLKAMDQSKLETEISVAFLILQLTNSAPVFVTPGASVSDSSELWKGRISESATVGSQVQFEQPLQVHDPDHGQNGTLDLRLEDPVGAFQIQPSVAYRNQSVQILLEHPERIKFERLAQTNVTLKVSTLIKRNHIE